MRSLFRIVTAAGIRARRLCVFAAVLSLASASPRADSPATPRIDVSEAGGAYTVTAAFAVSEPPEAVMAVLTDYERIPTYVPDMEISRIVERHASGMIVEQQALSKFMMFSKRVHLLLDIHEGHGSIRFSDRCGRSFSAYAGSWTVSQHDSLTVVDYELRATPNFDVPSFVLKRLLKRDSALLVARLKAEISERAHRRK